VTEDQGPAAGPDEEELAEDLAELDEQVRPDEDRLAFGGADDDGWVEEADAEGDLADYTGERAGGPGQLDDEGSLGASEAPDAEDAMLLTWSDDDDALGTESGGFGPDRPRDARMPGLYDSDEVDDVSVDDEAVDAPDPSDPADQE
jgi:hypothetical protein